MPVVWQRTYSEMAVGCQGGMIKKSWPGAVKSERKIMGDIK
jgi:hypothetical protein